MTPHEAEEVLSKLVRPTGSFLHDLNHPSELLDYARRPFIGRVKDGRFKFHRVITRRNSFLPIISGEIGAAEGGAELRGIMRLNVAVAILVAWWLTFSAYVGFQRFPRAWAESNIMDAVLAVGMPAFGLALTIGGFVTERHKAMRLLSDAFGTRHAGQHP